MPAADRNRCRSARHSRYFKAACCAWLVAIRIAAVASIPRCIPGSQKEAVGGRVCRSRADIEFRRGSLVPRLTVSNRIM